jgi:hypothetical protein
MTGKQFQKPKHPKITGNQFRTSGVKQLIKTILSFVLKVSGYFQVTQEKKASAHNTAAREPRTGRRRGRQR